MFTEKEIIWKDNDGRGIFSIISDPEDLDEWDDLEEWKATRRCSGERDEEVSILEEEESNELH